MWYIIGKIRGIPLFGTLCLFIVLIFSDYSFKDIYNLALNMDGFKGLFSAYLFYSLCCLPIIEIIFIILRKINEKFFRGSEYDWEAFFVTLGRDLFSPILAISTLYQALTDRKFLSTAKGWIETIFGFFWVLFGGIFITIGLIVMI